MLIVGKIEHDEFEFSLISERSKFGAKRRQKKFKTNRHFNDFTDGAMTWKYCIFN